MGNQIYWIAFVIVISALDFSVGKKTRYAELSESESLESPSGAFQIAQAVKGNNGILGYQEAILMGDRIREEALDRRKHLEELGLIPVNMTDAQKHERKNYYKLKSYRKRKPAHTHPVRIIKEPVYDVEE